MQTYSLSSFECQVVEPAMTLEEVPRVGVREPYDGTFEIVLPLQDHSPCGTP